MTRVKDLKSWVHPAKLVAPLMILSTLLGLAGLQKQRLGQITEESTASQYHQDALRQRASLALWQKLPQGGFSNLIANGAFLQFLQYFGDQPARNVTGQGLNPEFLGTVVRHDPRFIDAYLYMSPASSLYAGRPDQTVAAMTQGLQSLSSDVPNAYWIWIYKGVDELLFLNNSAEAKHSYMMGGNWAERQHPQTDETRRVIQSSQETVTFLGKSNVSRAVRINAWLMLLGNSRDDVKLQRFIFDKVQALGAKLSVSPEGRLQVQMPPEANELTVK
jgi:hypothetical protein